MVRGMFKSRTLRRVFKTTPGNETKVQYKKRKPSAAKCVCGATLSGVPRERPHVMRNLSKTEKRPERPYGGNLCSACTREKIKLQARQQED